MNWKRLFKQNDLQIRVIKQWTQNDRYPTAGVLLQVKNGKGILKETIGEQDGKGYATLTFQDVPLLQFHGDEYFCPTCEKLIRSGYQLEQDFFEIKGINDALEDSTLQEAIHQLSPLWGLLPSGYYIIHDTQLYPSDGNGHLFWNYPNEHVAQVGSCPVYFGDGRYGLGYPKFTIATQSRFLYHEERVAYYQKHSNARAIAYYMDGYLCALLDGHHKMMAAAKNHTQCNALVIERCTIAYNRKFHYLNSTLFTDSNCEDFKISEREYNSLSKQMFIRNTPEETQAINTSMDAYREQPPFLQSDMENEHVYPSVEQEAAKEYIGKSYKHILDAILHRKDISMYDDVDIFFKAMPCLFSYEECKHIARLVCDYNYPNQIAYDMLNELVKLPRDEEVLQLLIDMYITYDDCSYIKDLLSRYL